MKKTKSKKAETAKAKTAAELLGVGVADPASHSREWLIAQIAASDVLRMSNSAYYHINNIKAEIAKAESTVFLDDPFEVAMQHTMLADAYLRHEHLKLVESERQKYAAPHEREINCAKIARYITFAKRLLADCEAVNDALIAEAKAKEAA
ncbi:MAG TPA: hypothetical protein VGL61_06525 [Kofleriaceae bacterium]